MQRILEPTEALCDDDAQVYDSLSKKHYFCVDRPFVRKVASLGVRHGFALDIGCGPGHVAIDLALRCPGLTVYALDPSDTMLEIVRRNAIKAGVGDRVVPVQGDACDIPFEGQSFNLVISLHAWHHLPDPQPALKEIKRILKPGGTCMVRDLRRPRSAQATNRLVKLFGTMLKYNTDERRQYWNSLRAAFTLTEMRQWAREAGLTRARVSRQWGQHLDLIATPEPQGHPAPAARPSRPLRWLPPLAAAASLLLVTGFFLDKNKPADTVASYAAGRLTHAIGSLSASDTNTDNGMLTRIETPSGGFARFDQRDGTRLAVSEKTRLNWSQPSGNGAKTLEVLEGQAYLDVAPQPVPLVVNFASGHMQAEVLGTRLLASRTDAGYETIHLFKGRVRVHGLGDESKKPTKRLASPDYDNLFVYQGFRRTLTLDPGQTAQYRPRPDGNGELVALLNERAPTPSASWLGKIGLKPDSGPAIQKLMQTPSMLDKARATIASGAWRFERRGNDIAAVYSEPDTLGGMIFLGDSEWTEGDFSFKIALNNIEKPIKIGIGFRTEKGAIIVGHITIDSAPAGIYRIRARFEVDPENNGIMVRRFELWPANRRKAVQTKTDWRLRSVSSREKLGPCAPGVFIEGMAAEFSDFKLENAACRVQ